MKKLISYSLQLLAGFNVLLTAASCNSAYQPIEPGAKINEYELETAGGEKVKLSGLLNGKITLLHFWASWCPTCADELPQLNKFYEQYSSQGVNVIGIVVEDSKEKIAAMQNQYDLKFPILFDPDQKMISKFKLEGLPETFIVDKDLKLVLFPDPVGMPVVRIMGNREWLDESMLGPIRKLLN